MRLRQLGTWAIVLGLSLPVWASGVDRPGAISGYVRNATGEPQMGAVVQILGTANRTFTVFTDGAGYYNAVGLLPGLYTLKVTAPSFLPALREKIGLRPGASLNVNVTLNTLLGVMQLGPVRALPDDDDWKWTLRSVANRPILRIFNDPTWTAEKQSHELTGSLSFFGGSSAGGYGSGSDMSTGFTLERSVFSDGHLAFSGNVGYGEGLPAAVLRAGYSRQMLNGSQPSLALTVRRFSASDPNLHNAALQALALSASDDISVGDILELRFGSELQTIQFLGRVTAFRPYGSADLHLSPNTVVEYNYTTSRPDLRSEKGFDSSPADLSESNPRVSLLEYAPKVERLHHQEVSVSHRMGNTNVQLAAFSDRVSDPALTGIGDVTAAGGFLLPDVSSGTFNYAGKNLDTNGLRVVLQHKFSSDLTATLDYAYGGVLDLTKPDVPLQNAQQWIGTERRHALAAKLSGTVPRTHTRWITSYRWINGSAITPVDMFNASPGQSDPFLNVFVRQPIPSMGFLPGHMEAIIDLRNLLAQGYVPVMGRDGQTVYLVQSARSVRGGVAFTF
ncbi:MAG TPA: carboxypeptidase-like regulatory domain-containing protein [Candidatus Sulfotelmatobacter sp.]|nr:carboxypeptidase-like regulatory domain-containing protein [Candidatus Sulfotelmatobacter sp.]